MREVDSVAASIQSVGEPYVNITFPLQGSRKTWWQEVTTERLRSQTVTLRRGQHIKYRPYAFTEHGILMLSSLLNSERAVQVNIEIMRTFVRLRHMLSSNAELAKKLEELERKYDRQFRVVFDAIRQLMTPSEPKRKQIGFHAKSLKR